MSDIKEINDRWKNRRIMAWVCFGVWITLGCVRYLLPLHRPELLPMLKESDTFLLAFMGMLVSNNLSYYGFSTMDDRKR